MEFLNYYIYKYIIFNSHVCKQNYEIKTNSTFKVQMIMLFHVLFRILPHSFLFSTPVFKTMLKAKSQPFFCTQ